MRHRAVVLAAGLRGWFPVAVSGYDRRRESSSMDPTVERAKQRVGEEIADKYLLTRLLGSGGMGAVYEALHRFTQRRVAVKLMHPSFARSAVAAERFLREAQAPSSIGHPGIVEVLDGGRDRDGSLYLVLELLEGETLADAIKGGPLRPQRAGAIVLELLDALSAAHEAGFVHRDIKPENIFLAPADADEPLVKLLDFGVAGMLSESSSPGLTVAGAVLGTPLYMSPEQALGRRVDARSDLWSVGAVMYQALAGRPPFGGDSMQALIISIATQEHLPLAARRPDLPVRMVTLVERALHKDVAQRWQSAAEMSEALRQALEHGQRPRERAAALSAPGVVVPVTRAQPVEAHDARSWLLGVALVATLGAVGARWVMNRESVVAQRPAPAVSAISKPATTAIAEPSAPKPAPSATTAALAPPSAPKPAPSPVLAVQPIAPRLPAPAALDSDALSKVLEAHQDELQRCYQDAIVASMTAPGAATAPPPSTLRVDFDLAVSHEGEVQQVTLRGDTPADMRRCATDAVRAWRFPASGRPSDLSFPVVFQPTIVRR